MEGLSSIPIRATAIYGQCAYTGRFQHYTEDWFDHEQRSRAELIDFGLVKEMKIAMFIGLWDNTCNVKHAAEQRAQMMDTVAMWEVSPFNGHVPWGFVNNPWFIDKLMEALMLNADI